MCIVGQQAIYSRCVYDLLIKIHNICTQTMRKNRPTPDALNIASHQRTYVHIIHYRSLYFILLYLSSCAPALFMIITAVINIHNVILVLFSISTCAISFIILLRFCLLLFIHIIFAHIFCPHICFCMI